MSLRERLKELNLGIRERIPSELDLHHIGSTSIPNIHAKPILDILGVVTSIEAFDNHQSELEALGFVWKSEYGIANRRYCVLYDENEEFGLIHLHVFAKSDREVEKHLVFRDYLRDSSEASRRYEDLKKKLADAHTDARANYSEGKVELIAQLLSEAFEWKKLKIARHETGHAVIAFRYGQKIQKVSLKEMDSLTETDNYRAFMKLEPVDPTIKFTGERAIQKIMISLSGYASEILFYDVANIGGDDLTVAAKTAEDMLQVVEFRSWVSTLPLPGPSPLDMIENPLVRAYIHHKMGECIQSCAQIRPAIQAIADELYKREELTGDEVSALFNTCHQSMVCADQVKRPFLNP